MIRLLRDIAADQNGNSVVEFTLVSPLIITVLIGALNVGSVFFATNSLNHAIDVTAREASVYPTPSDTDLRAVFKDALLKREADGTATLLIGTGTASNGTGYVTLSSSYNVPVDMIFFNLGTVAVTSSRRVYAQS